MNISVAEAKATFSELCRRAEAGEEIAVTRHGKVVARILPPEHRAARRSILGAFKDQPFLIKEDFDDLGSEWDEYTR